MWLIIWPVSRVGGFAFQCECVRFARTPAVATHLGRPIATQFQLYSKDVCLLTFSVATSMRLATSTKRHRVEIRSEWECLMNVVLEPMETIYHNSFRQMQSVFILVTCWHPSIRPIFRILKCHGHRRPTWNVEHTRKGSCKFSNLRFVRRRRLAAFELNGRLSA